MNMGRKIIGGKIVGGEEYLMEQRGELEGFHHLRTGFFYAIKGLNRDRLEIDAYLEDELRESFDCKRTHLLGELWVEDIHNHLNKTN